MSTEFSFVVHHLTDIHIGPLHFNPKAPEYLNEYKRRADRFETYVNQLSTMLDEHLPDLVVISGDLTSYGTKEELELAENLIRSVVGTLKRKTSSWRKGNQNEIPPYVMIVPGNHDLQWDQDDKVKAFATMAHKLADHGEVLSSNYYQPDGTPKTDDKPKFYDFEDPNVFVYLFDSTAYGGSTDESYKKVHNQLAILEKEYKELSTKLNSSDDKVIEELEKVKKIVKDASRKDPGYIKKTALLEAAKILRDVPKGRLKIAVMHHNPTIVVQSQYFDEFAEILNSGQVKSALAGLGFDVVLFGHRHAFHCGQERVQYDPDFFASEVKKRDDEAELEYGMLFVAGDSLGQEEQSAFVELSIRDQHAHEEKPPACLLSVHRWKLGTSGLGYSPESKPRLQVILSTPIYDAFNRVARNIGRRQVLVKDKEGLQRAIDTVLPPIQQLRGTLVDWSSDKAAWIRNFHAYIERYSAIYATDLSERASVQNIRYATYLRQQYIGRMKKLGSRTTVRELKFSPPVFQAIKKTHWLPSTLLWDPNSMAVSENQKDWCLEIARILIRPAHIPSLEDYEMLRDLNFNHRLFAIPLFTLDIGDVEEKCKEDIAVGLWEDGTLAPSYRYDKVICEVRQITAIEDLTNLRTIFFSLLASDKLRSVGALLKENEEALKLPEGLKYPEP